MGVTAVEPAVRLGEITTPSGVLLLIDGGQLGLWAHDRPPMLPPGIVDEDSTAQANAGADFVVVGPDARAAGLAWDRSVHPLYRYDVRADAVDTERARFAAFCAEHGFGAALEPLPQRVPHRTRIDQYFVDGVKANGISFHGLWASAIAGLPRDRSLPVWGCRRTGPEFAGRWHEIGIDLVERPVPARTEAHGWIAVDEARILLGDADAIGAWEHHRPADGLMDLVFWGADAGAAAREFGAPALSSTRTTDSSERGPEPTEFGWSGLDLQEGLQVATELEHVRRARGWKLAIDVRPHSDHWRATEAARASGQGAGVVDVGGARMCLFFTGWGDGVYEVLADYDATGALVRVRIVLGSEQTLARMRRLDELFYGDLSRLALVSTRVLQQGRRVMWMFRRPPLQPDRHSGWELYAGDEDEHYFDRPDATVVLPLRELVFREPGLEPILSAPVGSAFERVDPLGPFERVEGWAPSD